MIGADLRNLVTHADGLCRRDKGISEEDWAQISRRLKALSERIAAVETTTGVTSYRAREATVHPHVSRRMH